MNQMINTVKMLSVQLNKNRSNRKIMNKMISKIEQIKCVKDDKIFLESFKEIMTSKNYFFPNIREIYIEKNLFPNTPKYIDVGPELKISIRNYAGWFFCLQYIPRNFQYLFRTERSLINTFYLENMKKH